MHPKPKKQGNSYYYRIPTPLSIATTKDPSRYDRCPVSAMGHGIRETKSGGQCADRFWNPLSCYYQQQTSHLSTTTHFWNMRHCTRNTKDSQCCPIALKVAYSTMTNTPTSIPIRRPISKIEDIQYEKQRLSAVSEWFPKPLPHHWKRSKGSESDASATPINQRSHRNTTIQSWDMQHPIKKFKNGQRYLNRLESQNS